MEWLVFIILKDDPSLPLGVPVNAKNSLPSWLIDKKRLILFELSESLSAF